MNVCVNGVNVVDGLQKSAVDYMSKKSADGQADWKSQKLVVGQNTCISQKSAVGSDKLQKSAVDGSMQVTEVNGWQ